MRGLCDCPGIESSQSKKGLGERVCPAASDGEVIYWYFFFLLFIDGYIILSGLEEVLYEDFEITG